MTKGASSKKSLLFIVALGAVGFAVIELMPAGKGTGQQSSTQQASAQSSAAASGLPVSLTTDPFVGVSGEPGKVSEDPGKAAPAQDPAGVAAQPEPMGGSMPMAGPWAPPMNIRGDQPDNPVKNTGSNQQSEKKPDTTVELQAIVAVKDRTAFLSVDGAEATAFREGSKVGADWRVLKITENEVLLASGKERARVTVGGKTNL